MRTNRPGAEAVICLLANRRAIRRAISIRWWSDGSSLHQRGQPKDAQPRGADYGADVLQKGADIGAHKFAAHGYDLPRSATKTGGSFGFDTDARSSQRFDVLGLARRKRSRKGRLRRYVNALCEARPAGFEPATLGSEVPPSIAEASTWLQQRPIF